MITTSTKLKTGTEYTLQGNTVFIDHDCGGGVVTIRRQKEKWPVNYVPERVELSDLKPALKLKQGIQAKPKKLNSEDLMFKAELNVFYDNQANVAPARCENCGAFFNLHTKWDYRKITCHILAKSDFPEVATHPSNSVFMCCDSGCFGHGNYDNKDAAFRETMPVYPIAIKRLMEFVRLIPDEKINKVYKYLNIKS